VNRALCPIVFIERLCKVHGRLIFFEGRECASIFASVDLMNTDCVHERARFDHALVNVRVRVARAPTLSIPSPRPAC
jgi:hypothetical protein